MTKQNVRIWVGALLLSACHSAPTRIHTLRSSPPAHPQAYQGSSVQLHAVHVPPGWDRIEILTLVRPGVLKINDLDRWSAPLTQVVRQTLITDLVARLPPNTVIYPHLAAPHGTLDVTVDILDFTLDLSHASMWASWTITSSATLETPQRRELLLATSLPTADSSAVVHAWSVLLGQLADQLVNDAASVHSQ